MNKLVTRHLSLVIAALAVTAASARTVSVSAVKDGAATAAFGASDGAAYTLAWGYGPADGGADTNAWAHFETLGEVAADATSRSVALPAGWGDTATHLRFFLLEPELPAAATRVEYLESSGTQWIDTGVNGETGLKFRADLEWDTSHNGKADWVLVGARNGTASSDYTRIVPIYIEKAVCFGYGRFVRTTTPTVLGVRHEIVTDYTDGSAVSIARDGTPITGYESGYYPTTGNVDAGRNLYIFAANWGGSANLFAKAKLYGLEIWRKDATTGALVPVRNFVPCTTNGVACLYDTVERRYYGNSGTGSFAVGAAMATPLLVAAASATASTVDFSAPDAYLDYVEATGTQWIDSGVNLRSNDTVVVDYGNPASILTKSVDLFGVHKSGLTARCVFSYSSGSSTIVFHKANGTQGATSTSTGVSVTPGTRQTVTMKIGAGTSSIVAASGERLYSGSLGGTIRQDATGPLYVFACNSSENGLMAISAAKLYSFRIYAEDGSLAHHFLPCKKGDAAALFDKQTGRILYPQGGALVAGPVLPRPAELVEWVQADGADGDRRLFLDTEVVGKAGVGMVAEMMWATKPAGNAVENVFCGATSSGSKRFWLYDAVADAGGNNATHRMGYNGWKLQLSSNNVVQAGIRYRVESSLAAGAQYLHVGSQNGTAAERAYTDSAAIDTERTLYVFANNNAGTAEPVTAAARLYSLVLTDDLGLARDFIPCVADNGRAGLYDRFTERVFFPQAAAAGATAAFDPATEIGAVTNVLAYATEPSARLRYIESDGISDFVDLGVIGRDGVKMVAEMEWATLDQPATFCGAAASSSSLFTTYRINGDQQRMGYANGSRTINSGTVAPVAGTRYRVTTTLDDGAQSLLVEKKVDGVWTSSGSRTATDAGPVDTGLPLILFARNLAGVPDEFAAARVYSLQLWRKDGNGDWQLERDLVPARLESGAAVLWDKATATPLFNAARYGFAATGAESVWRAGFIIGVW